jgi:hypothetical protein
MLTLPSRAEPLGVPAGRAYRWRGRAMALGFVLMGCGPGLAIEDESAAAFFRADRERLQQMQRAAPIKQRPTHLIRRAAPVRGFTADEPAPDNKAPLPPDEAAGQIADAPAAAPVSAAEDKAQAPRPADSLFTIAVLGDSLGVMLGQGLAEAYADRADISVLRRARENTGLVRDDYFDWGKAARDLLASNDKLSAAVILVGANDRQQLRDETGALDIRAPRWRQIYGDRVEAIAQAFKARKTPLIWVGLPVMKSERYSGDMERLNEVIRERAGKAGAIFVDVWDAFLDDRGQFATYGPDVNGQFQKLRAPDGVHFTRSGARKAAHFVETEINRLVDAAHPKMDPAVVTVDPRVTVEPPPLAIAPALPRVEPAKVNVDPLATLPALAPTPEVVIPVRPAAGNVVPLTGPVSARGGELATHGRRPRESSEAEALLDRTLTQGRPLDPRPGRADDFSWPRR